MGKEFDDPKIALLIDAPANDWDLDQEDALESCIRQRPSIMQVLEKHGVSLARIAPFASGRNDDRLPFITCLMRFVDDNGMNKFTRAVNVCSDIEELIDQRIHADLLD